MKKLVFMFAACAAISFASCGDGKKGGESDSTKKDTPKQEQAAPAPEADKTPAPAETPAEAPAEAPAETPAN